MKEKLYIGEATVATIAGLIFGPHCLNWFNPLTWGNTEYITLEICRIVLCIQIVAVAVELPRKYMKKHWLSVAIFLLPVMTIGWLVVGLFIWALIPHFKIADALLVSACITATDPILAAAVVGKGKFAERVPGHLRNLLSAESGCNDGMAFPFIYLSLNLITHLGHAGEIVKEWFLLTILWECVFGCVLGVVIGLVLRRAVKFAESKNLIDRESFLAIFVFIAFNSAGIGSMLGVDDLLVSFAAGTAFGWNGMFAKKTEESHVSTVIDLLLNLAFFVYFGAIVPWPAFNMSHIGLNVWRLIILAIVVIFLRRIPAVLMLKPLTPDLKSWREALFCGHFGPIGVGAIFASILARRELEHFVHAEYALDDSKNDSHPHQQLIATIWPIVCFVVITSILVHGSSVAVLTLGKRLNRMAITMSFTHTNTQDQGPTWMSRLQKLDKVLTSFSLHDMDNTTDVESLQTQPPIQNSNTIETSGIKVRPAGGAKRKRKGKNAETPYRPQTEFLQLGRTASTSPPEKPQSSLGDSDETEPREGIALHLIHFPEDTLHKFRSHENVDTDVENVPVPTAAYQDGSQIVIEDQHGEVLETVNTRDENESKVDQKAEDLQAEVAGEDGSIHSMDSLRRRISQYSSYENSINTEEQSENEKLPKSPRSLHKKLSHTNSKKKAYYNKNDPKHRKVFAHQCDNMIYIENEEGEVIRRYKVNKHTSSVPARSSRLRSSSIVGKALSLVGIKDKKSGPESAASPQMSPDLEMGLPEENMIVPTHDDPDAVDEKTKNRIERKLTSMLTLGASKKEPLNIGSPGSTSAQKQSRVLDLHDEHEEDDLSVSSREGETEVEKRRRLAALGMSRRHESDEEE